MSDRLYIAWRYLACHRIKTIVLVASITLIVYLPVGLRVLVGQSQRRLTARAEATPLLVGAKGSPLELALNSLYFNAEVPALSTYEQVRRVENSGLAHAIPLYVRFHARKFPIVGTTVEYLDYRNLQLAEGRSLAILGECVIGAKVAAETGLRSGDTIVSSPENVFDLAGIYPLEMGIVGVLEFTDSPDDEAIFVDLKTTWIIEGLGHGHEDLARPEAVGGVLAREGDRITANASVVQYAKIEASNLSSFHFHGETSSYPVTAVIAIPSDEKSGTILRGRFQGDGETQQIVIPAEVIDELLSTILTVQSFIIAAVLIVGLSTLATTALVFLLSLRLRAREIETMIKIGGSRGAIASILGLEIAIVMAISVVLAAILTLLTRYYGSELVRALILS